MNSSISGITADTRLSDLLAAYPSLKEVLPRIHAKFRILSTPLGKVMIQQATILEMSRRSGMDVHALISSIEGQIRCGR